MRVFLVGVRQALGSPMRLAMLFFWMAVEPPMIGIEACRGRVAPCRNHAHNRRRPSPSGTSARCRGRSRRRTSSPSKSRRCRAGCCRPASSRGTASGERTRAGLHIGQHMPDGLMRADTLAELAALLRVLPGVVHGLRRDPSAIAATSSFSTSSAGPASRVQPLFHPSSPPMTSVKGISTLSSVTSLVFRPRAPSAGMCVSVTPGAVGGMSTSERFL